MIPQGVAATVAAIIFFLLLVAPGIFFEILRDRQRPSWASSAFRETSRIALFSLAFSVFSLSFLSLIRILLPSLMPDPGAWLDQGFKYLKQEYQLVAIFVLTELLLAIGLAYLVNLALVTSDRWPSKLRKGWESFQSSLGPITKESTWYRTFARALKENQELKDSGALVRVRVKDGFVYQGIIDSFSTDLELENRELELGPPLKRGTSEAGELSRVSPWQRLLLPASEVQAIWVTYISKEIIENARNIVNEPVESATISEQHSPGEKASTNRGLDKVEDEQGYSGCGCHQFGHGRIHHCCMAESCHEVDRI